LRLISTLTPISNVSFAPLGKTRGSAPQQKPLKSSG